MKGQLKASTPAEYLAQLEEPRKSEVAALDALIRKNAPKLAPFIHSGMLAYGPWHYKYASGRAGVRHSATRSRQSRRLGPPPISGEGRNQAVAARHVGPDGSSCQRHQLHLCHQLYHHHLDSEWSVQQLHGQGRYGVAFPLEEPGCLFHQHHRGLLRTRLMKLHAFPKPVPAPARQARGMQAFTLAEMMVSVK